MKSDQAECGVNRYVPAMLSDWLSKLLRETGVSQAELARQLTASLGRSIDRAAVNKMASGQRKIAADEMLAITRLLKKPDESDKIQEPERLPLEIRPSTSPLVPVRKAGRVEAGAFRAQEDLGDWDEAETTLDIRDSKFPNARHLSFDVEGDSMNALKPRPILGGDTVSCVAYEDVDTQAPLRDGMVVVVERTRFGGQEREWSIKQLELYADRVEFHPRSTNPKHKPIVVKRDPGADDGTKVEIIALVRRVTNELT
ncbi:LexA family protein [Bosea eneae]|uniref:LexA family protein n=1 Tax=Bosea eneae TaxID=151454 RepID=A0ABW0J0N9_9HYPH